MRSRPRQEFAYSPIGAGGSASVLPLLPGGRRSYTQPVENAMMREAWNACAILAGTTTFINQVCASLPSSPNLRPAMYSTFSLLGSLATAMCIGEITGDGLDA